MKLATKVLILILGVGVFVRSVLMVWEILQTKDDILQQNTNLHKVLLSSNIETIANAVYNVEDKRLEILMASLFELGELSRVWIYEEDGTFFKAFQRGQGGGAEETRLTPGPLNIDFKKPQLPYALSGARLVSEAVSLEDGETRLISTLWVMVNDTPVFVGHILSDFGHKKADQLLFKEIQTKAFSGLIFIGLLVVVLFIFLNKTVIRRVIYLEHASQKMAARADFDFDLDQGQDEIAKLNRSFSSMAQDLKGYTDNLEKLVADRTHALKSSRDKVASILENIEQGIVTFDASLRIEPEYSAFITKLYQISDPSGHDVLQTLFPSSSLSSDELDQARQALISSLDQDELSWMGNEVKLPAQAQVKIKQENHYIAADWKAILDEEGMTRKVMLTIRDVTESQKLQKKLMEEEGRSRIIIELVKVRHGKKSGDIFRILDHMTDLLTNITWNDTLSEFEQKKILVLLHTLKGESRTLGLRILSTQIHEVESMLKQADVKVANIQPAIAEVLKLITVYVQTLEHIFEDHSESNGSSNLLTTLHDGLLDLNRRLAEHDIVLEDLTILDEVQSSLSPHAWNGLKSIFLHVLNNIGDHGYILPFKESGKRRNARLKIQAKVIDQNVRISVADNGAGLNVERLREKARQMNLEFDPNAPENILFHGGVSTASSVSQTSGRGIGMKAVHDMVHELGGNVTFRPNPEGQGSLLTIVLPVSASSSTVRDRCL